MWTGHVPPRKATNESPITAPSPGWLLRAGQAMTRTGGDPGIYGRWEELRAYSLRRDRGDRAQRSGVE
jgi:hypothetical protein